MAHVGEKFALGAASRQRGLFGLDQFFFPLLALGNIEKGHHRTHGFLAAPDRITLVFGRETGAVGPPQHVLVAVHALALAHGSVNRALLLGIGPSVRAGVVRQFVHILAQQIARPVVTEHVSAGRIAERAVALGIYAKNRLGR